jgi:two-component system, NarL family, invasion response regulator UvrY
MNTPNVGRAREPSLRILIVDDSHTMRTKLCYWLRHRFPGCICLEAASGEEAVVLVRAEEPAVVLVDVFLPGMSGFETTEAIKSLMPEVPVIVLSVNEAYTYSVTAEAAGASAFVSKADITEKLFPLLNEIFRNRDE